MNSQYQNLCIIFIILTVLVPSAIGEPGKLVRDENQTPGNFSETWDNTIDGNGTHNSYPDQNSLSIQKRPNSAVIYSNETDSTVAGNKSVNMGLAGNSNSNSSITENVSGSTEEYHSLEDIIRAQDWKALGEYKCKLKNENPDLFDTSTPSMSDKEAKWDSFFNGPPPPAPIPSCCG